ncbi:BgTH12-06430 [Blumeria graminis f. sp. triticale]|uniref:BgtE-20051 n=2 Tax=Blumeria graminis TaxID=34373 RepID=A0A9X9LAW9_BLUGR|nr:BgTH12-06430 [Blumeria graminis f. sp. triticale]VCU41000.1 BgtE-20051 [Blumeria graminis f. sp. tritici]
MKFIHFTKATTILSLFTSLCATQAVNDGYAMFNCHGVIFYSESVFASAAKAHSLTLGQVNHYPIEIISSTFSGQSPHRLFPMVLDTEVYQGGPLSYFFVVVDRNGREQGLVFNTQNGYQPCQLIL